MPRIPAEERRMQFVEAAARVIAAEGLPAATTRRIAAEADAPLAALHYCFRNKDALLEEVYNFLSRDYAKSLTPIEDLGAGLPRVIRQHAQRIWDRMLERPHEQVTTFELLLRRFREPPESEPVARAQNRSMYEGWVTSTAELFASACRASGQDVPLHLDLVARLFISGIDGISMQHIADPDTERSQALIALLADSLVELLARSDAAASDSAASGT
ncbi:AcrR family transcriptional regulator [Sinomonas atrocyanea]|uniref:TetR/AcrR family transcriptional regulator n=1 Tax=Sinomonas atrocyanea TaxID=37927 RepID=UPI00277E013F|nr:TetR/AcrR family transcriptional regulator [Sinomonas atrocyanea]MDQ0258257.1 AcrR family transcriptional regulator [Sinomonas atrocyanea]